MLGLSPFITILINTLEGEGPEGDIVVSSVLQSPTGSVGISSHFSNVRSTDNRTIVRGLRGISRRSEVLERIHGGFPLVDPLGV